MKKPKATPFNLGPMVEIVGHKGTVIKGYLVLPATAVAVPRQFLFDAVKVIRRAESVMASIDGAVRGMSLPRGALSDTELGKAHLDLSELREDVEDHSMRTGAEATKP